MPCCILCLHYKIIDNVPRVNKECPLFLDEGLPPKSFLTKGVAPCCEKCAYFKQAVKEKPWWCQRPFAFEVCPANAAEATVFSSRSVVRSIEK